MRVRIVHELVAHRALYLDDAFLSRGLATEETRNVALRYGQYSPWYVPGATLTDCDIDQLYKKEVADVIRPGAFCGMQQLHAVASILGTRIDSLYPGQCAPEQDLNIVLIPRESSTGDAATLHRILWTNTTNNNLGGNRTTSFPSTQRATPYTRVMLYM